MEVYINILRMNDFNLESHFITMDHLHNHIIGEPKFEKLSLSYPW